MVCDYTDRNICFMVFAVFYPSFRTDSVTYRFDGIYDYIFKILSTEENAFYKTIDKGMEILKADIELPVPRRKFRCLQRAQ